MIPNLVLLVGLPGSGKSTYASDLKEKGYRVHSSDELRIELYSDVNDISKNVELFQELHKRIGKDLSSGLDCVLDSTNLSYKRRVNLLNKLNKIDCHKKAIVMATPYNQCVLNDLKRERTVGYKVVNNMYKSFELPHYHEKFEEIEVIFSDYDKSEWDWRKEYSRLSDIPQHNSNHDLTIGNHCKNVYNLLKEKSSNDSLILAGLFHDWGKAKCGNFMNSKGLYSKQQHFYSHEKISAYDAMFYLKNMEMIGLINTLTNAMIVQICNYIQYHMVKYRFTNAKQKTIDKFRDMVGDEFWKELILFNECDEYRGSEDCE